jgi:integrase/recombinase XerD
LKYVLDARKDFNTNLLFWMQKFLYDVASRSQSRFIKKDEIEYRIYFKKLSVHDIFNTFEELKETIRQLRNYGIKTMASYSYPLFALYEYLISLNLLFLVEINENVLMNFMKQLNVTSSVTKNNYKQMTILFFKFIDEHNADHHGNSHHFNIQLHNFSNNGSKKLPEYLNQDEIRRFLQALEIKEWKKQNNCMNRLIIKILLFSGIRADELINIKISDIYLENNFFFIKVLGKGNKERIVNIVQNKINEDYNDWISIHQGESDFLFMTLNKKKISTQFLNIIMSEIFEEANLTKGKMGPHILRHTFATNLYKETKDILLVKKALGHADLNTVQIYTHI